MTDQSVRVIVFNMKAIKKDSPKERIIEVAHDLFYTQGYLATGINQVIKEAKVSKASFYDHFPSKEALCVAYLQERHNRWNQWFKDYINSYKEPYPRFIAPFGFLKKWMDDSSYRGCAFLNIASEIPDINSNIRKEVKYHKEGLRTILKEGAKDLKKSGPEYAHLDGDCIGDIYYVILEGAITAAQNFGEPWPIDQARNAIEQLISAAH